MNAVERFRLSVLAIPVAVLLMLPALPRHAQAQGQSIAEEAAVMRTSVDHILAKTDALPCEVALDPQVFHVEWAPGLIQRGVDPTRLRDLPLVITRIAAGRPFQIRTWDELVDCPAAHGRCVLRGASVYLRMGTPAIEGDRARLRIHKRTPAGPDSRTATYLKGWDLTLERVGGRWRVVEETLTVMS